MEKNSQHGSNPITFLSRGIRENLRYSVYNISISYGDGRRDVKIILIFGVLFYIY